MLLQFTVENFRCFRDATTLSLRASLDKSLPDNVAANAAETTVDVLKTAGIFGANASGKSNLIVGLETMQRLVLGSFQDGVRWPEKNREFRLDAAQGDQPTTLEAHFVIEGERFAYGFAVDDRRIVSEWLFTFVGSRRRKLFSRETRHDGDVEISFGASWRGIKKSLAKQTREDALFLTVAAKLNHPLARRAFGWFADTLRFAGPMAQRRGEELFTCRLAQEEERVRQAILEILKLADLRIDDVDVEDLPFSASRAFANFSEKDMRRLEEKSGVSSDKLRVLEPFFFRRGQDKDGEPHEVRFHLSEESAGTQKIYRLAGPLLRVFDKGMVLVIDELDNSLHPLLTRQILKLFHSPNTNPKAAQLIFSSHDPTLLDNHELLRRDQIWLTEVATKNGASQMSSLWDFRVRKDENLRRAYLAGRYGGVPYVEGLSEALVSFWAKPDIRRGGDDGQ